MSSWCLVMVGLLFLTVPWGCLLQRFVIVVFSDHTHLLFLRENTIKKHEFLQKEDTLSHDGNKSNSHLERTYLQYLLSCSLIPQGFLWSSGRLSVGWVLASLETCTYILRITGRKAIKISLLLRTVPNHLKNTKTEKFTENIRNPLVIKWKAITDIHCNQISVNLHQKAGSWDATYFVVNLHLLSYRRLSSDKCFNISTQYCCSYYTYLS